MGEDEAIFRFVPVQELSAGRHFDAEIGVFVCSVVKLSHRDFVIMISERGIVMVHMAILRWVQQYTPEFEKRWKRYLPG
jgi:transposase-like protein